MGMQRFTISALGLALWCMSDPTASAVVVVNSTFDGALTSIDGNKSCELREAVRNVNTSSQLHEDCAAGDGIDDEIHLSVPGTIVLVGAADENQAESGDLDLLRDVVIRNVSAGTVTIDGNGIDRVFDAVNGTVIDWSILGSQQGIVVQNGLGGFAGGCILSGRNSTLTLDSVTVTGCEVGFNGAGLSTGGNTVISNSTFTNNVQTASNNGGGGIQSYLGTLEIIDSVISGNEAYRGGGVQVVQEGNLSMTGSTVTDNHARETGGGIDVYFSDEVSTIGGGTLIEGNTAAQGGGGIAMVGGTSDPTRLDVEDTTIGSLTSPNQSDTVGGGIWAEQSELRLNAGTQVVGNIASGTGGGVYVSSEGILHVSSAVIAQNQADFGGGIDLVQSVGQIEDSLIVANQSQQSGGGLRFYADAGEQLTILRSIWRSNQAGLDPAFSSGGGGAIMFDGFVAGQMTISASEFSGNQVMETVGSAYGGAIMARLDSSIANTTFSGNSAPNGGALGWNSGSTNIVINNATFYANTSTNGQGAHIGSIGTVGSLQMTNSLLVFAPQGQHCFPSSHTGIAVDASNLAWQGGVCDQAVEGNPMLGPLADNGGLGPGVPGSGFPRSHAIVDSDSAALDNPLTAACEPDDQRGVLRNAICDQGAFEAVDLVRDEIFQDRFSASNRMDRAPWRLAALTSLRSDPGRGGNIPDPL
jgi:hypothetical protein